MEIIAGHFCAKKHLHSTDYSTSILSFSSRCLVHLRLFTLKSHFIKTLLQLIEIRFPKAEKQLFLLQIRFVSIFTAVIASLP